MSDKKQDVLDAIEELFGDRTLSIRECLEALEEVRDETENKIQALREDLKAGRG